MSLVLNYASKDSTEESLDDVKEFLPKICKQCLKNLQDNQVNSLFVIQKTLEIAHQYHGNRFYDQVKCSFILKRKRKQIISLIFVVAAVAVV